MVARRFNAGRQNEITYRRDVSKIFTIGRGGYAHRKRSLPIAASLHTRSTQDASQARRVASHKKQTYRSSSITCSSTSLPGLTADSGSVASGSSVMFNKSTKVGVFELT